MYKKLIFILSLIFMISCGDSKVKDLCKENPCKEKNRTICKQEENNFLCLCDNGYKLKNNICLKDSPCLDKTCQENSTCKVKNEIATCECNKGFTANGKKCEAIVYESFYKSWEDDIYNENSAIALTKDSKGNIIIVAYQSGKQLENNKLSLADTVVKKYSYQGELIWTKVWHDELYDMPTDVVSDENDNIFVVGETGSEFYKAFLFKLDSNGNKIWTKEWSCKDGLIVWDLEIDKNELYFTGRTYSKFNNTSSLGGGSDAYLIKVKDMGNSVKEEWIKQWGSNLIDEGKAIKIKNNTLHVLTHINGNTNTTEGNIAWDYSISKFDKSGNLLSNKVWMQELVDTYLDNFVMDNHENYYITGDSPRNFISHTNKGKNDFFVLKLNEKLELEWSQLIGTEYYDTVKTISLDSKNNIFIAGHTYGSIPGFTNKDEGIETDALLIKIDNSGNIQWYKSFASDNKLSGDTITDMMIINDNIIFVGLEDANYMKDTQNLKSKGFLRQIIKQDYDLN